MNKFEALEMLKETRQLNTKMLEPLDTSFERFLRIAQFSKVRYEKYIDKLIKREEEKVNAKFQEILDSKKSIKQRS